MMSKTPRWQDTRVTSKANKHMQKKMPKDSLYSVKSCSSSTRNSVSVERSNSFTSRDLSCDSKVGGNLKLGSIKEQDTRSASRPSRPAIRLCSSRSFSSFHSSSFATAPFIRSSRSLNRLDHRVKDEKKGLDSGKLSTSLKSFRDPKVSPLDISEDMKTSLSCASHDSSFVATCHHNGSKEEKQTRDGVYTLCAMTSGIRRNWVQAVLRNVRPSPTPAITNSTTEKGHQQEIDLISPDSLEEQNSGYTVHSKEKQDRNIDQQRQEEQRHANQINSHKSPVSALTAPISPSTSSTTLPFNPPLNKEGTEDASDLFLQNTELLNDASKNGVLNSLPINHTEKAKKEDGHPSAVETGQLVKKLEKTQTELSQLVQCNTNLQDKLQREKEQNLSFPQSDLLYHPASSLEQVALQHLQKINQDLRSELETQKRNQEEAREAELRRRVDLLAQQAQLLVTGDATALAQAQLEQDRRQFNEKQLELEQCIASLKTQLCSSEEKRAEAESRLIEVQQELQGLCDLQQEANQLRQNYLEVTSQLHSYEENQTQKEARLEKHLMLLQASQERERRSLAANLAQAERRTHDLQEQLERAEEQVENLNKSQAWTKEIEEAQKQLQEELQCTISAMQQVQEERDQLERQCHELQSNVSESEEEVSRLQGRLKTDENHFYNLEHSYERVCEELQVALGKVRQWETEAQDMREGYERQLDQKEQELTEVLLKMEVLGNSLEETEMKLNDVKDKNLTDTDDVENYIRTCSHSFDPSNQSTEGDDPERFMSVIQFLESKLYISEEKLKDITQRLEDYQNHVSCQDPHLCSQLTQTRANAQHLGLLLHTQAKHNQRFAQEMENRCRMLVGRFQVALNIVQACRGRLQEAGSLIDVGDFEKQLATLVNCLQQGEKDAERQQHESRNASKEEERILNDRALTDNIDISEEGTESASKSLSREIFVVETMASILKSKNIISQLQLKHKENEGDLSQRYKSILSQKVALKAQRRDNESVESVVSNACVEAELIYTAFKLQQQKANFNTETFEFASNEEADDYQSRSVQVKAHDKKKGNRKVENTIWQEELISTLQKMSIFLRELTWDIPEESTLKNTWGNDVKWVHEQAKVIYLTHRLYFDLKQEINQKQLQATCKEQEVTLQQRFNETLCQLQEGNSVLREELERAEQRVIIVETGNQKLLEDIQKIENFHAERMQKLETEFQEKIQELQRIHEEEMKHLHDYYSKSCFSKDKQSKITEKKTSVQTNENWMGAADSHLEELDTSEYMSLVLYHQRFSAMEEMHKKLISDLQRQHQKEVAKLLKEKDQLLKEETAATLAAIVAMRRAHKEELEKTRRSQHIRENSDASQLHIEYEKELQTLHKDLELLSVQHTQKCLENSQLSQELQQERKSLMHFQKENQELKKKQREDDDVYCQSSLNGKHVTSPENDLYEMEVILRAREAEMQFLRHEALSLKEELKHARLDTIYAQNKLKSLCMRTPDEKLYEDLKCATWSPGREGQKEMFSKETNKSDVAFQNESVRLPLPHQPRAVRSKSLKEGLSVQERMKLFES